MVLTSMGGTDLLGWMEKNHFDKAGAKLFIQLTAGFGRSFVHEVETRPPFRKKFLPEVKAMFRRLAPYTPFHLRLVMGNVWLFGPVMKRVMPAVSAQAVAMLQTTIAFTMQSGADACNVLSQEASVRDT